jgi:hypothetical protein
LLCSACEDARALAPTQLRDVPMILGLRVEVVAEGPNSEDLFPIPVDRVRSEPLPGDTMMPRALVVDETGILDPADFDPQWMLCSRAGSCRPDDAMPHCRDGLPGSSPCLLDRGASPQLVVPELDPNRDVLEQAALELFFIGSRPGRATTDECIAKLQQDPLPSLDGCLLAEADMWIGPLGTLVLVSDRADPSIIPPSIERPFTEQANFNPEIPPSIVLKAPGINAPEYVATATGATTIPADKILVVTGTTDRRDSQQIVYPPQFSGEFAYEELHDSLWANGSAMLASEFVFTPPSGDFFLVIVVDDDRGGIGWAKYDFVVDAAE